jgi:S-DNA-T family DNA segregation ATPase FtsK/SpoIIIE
MQEQKMRQLRVDTEVSIAFVLSILIFLSCLGAGGAAGKILGSFLFGMFGIPAFLFAFLFLYLSGIFIANGLTRMSVRVTASISGIYIFLCAFMQLVLRGYHAGEKLTEIYLSCSRTRTGGGLTGGIVVQFCGMLFGSAGACVITLAGIFVSLMLLTQTPVLSKVRARQKAAYKDMTPEEIAEEKEKRRLIRREKREAARAEKELAHAVRMQEKARREKAKLVTEQARLVEPQTIAASDAKTPVMEMPGESPKETAVPGLFAADIPDDIIDNAFADLPEEIEISGGFGEEVPPVTGRRAAMTVDDLFPTETKAEKTEKKTQKKTQKKTETAPETAEAEASSVSATAEDAQPEQKYARKGRPSVGEVEKLEVPEREEVREYTFPPLDLLQLPSGAGRGDTNEQLKETAAKLQQVLHTFGVEVSVNHISRGPTVTRYELTPQMGVKVSKILSLQDDIKLNLAAADIRIEAPIPGKAAIGIEVPNKTKTSVMLRELLDTDAFRNHKSPLAFAVGKDIAGQPVIGDIAKMPHLLIAGATGSGKSVFINTLIMSIIYKAKPEDVKFIMVDPKVVELSVYNGIPHMLIPVVTDPKKAAAALNWAVAEMTDRYAKFAQFGARDLKSYNEKIDQLPESEENPKPKKMSRIVIIVDELADLMMVAQNEVEDAICRLAQLARACGIHLVIATQRPSVNVITGLIKANMPSRVALSVTSGVDSRTIIDMNGAEKLLGNGDMLYYPQGYQKPARLQGAFLSDDEIAKVGRFLKERYMEETGVSQAEEIQKQMENHSIGSVSPGGDAMDTDEYFTEAGKLIIEKDKASIGMLQRAFRVGFNRAARIMDQLCDAGVVGAEEGTKPRKVLMTMEEFDNYLEEN